MKYIKLTALLYLFAYSCTSTKRTSQIAIARFHIAGTAQGTTYSIIYYAEDSLFTKADADSIFISLDSSLSIYKPYSLISRFNEETNGVQMDKHLETVIRKSLTIYKQTGGISDITVFPFVKLWGFGATKISSIPDSATLHSLLPCIGSDKIFIDGKWLKKKKPCVKIDVNGIAQGYTVDVISKFLEQKQIRNYLVEVGGELRIRGHRLPGNEPFTVGIESPPADSLDDPVVKNVFRPGNGAVTSSGTFRRYIESEGKHFHHLIDPKTGYPFQNELISVTVRAKDAITADGYDNALMGMGLEKAFRFLQKHKELQAYFIYKNNNGMIADTATRLFYKEGLF
jgi:thiamine biosynthesis lipoprotein